MDTHYLQSEVQLSILTSLWYSTNLDNNGNNQAISKRLTSLASIKLVLIKFLGHIDFPLSLHACIENDRKNVIRILTKTNKPGVLGG